MTLKLSKVIHFGKHAGTRWEELPEHYVEWLAENFHDKQIVEKAASMLRRNNQTVPKHKSQTSEIAKRYGENNPNFPKHEFVDNGDGSTISKTYIFSGDRWR